MILAILQARYSSTRLPGKILKDILDQPMLLHQINRINKSKLIDKLVVATSNDISDDIVEKRLVSSNIDIFRGSLDDVLDRYCQCALKYNPDYIVRITGDCPLIDWNIIDMVIKKHIDEGNDYTSNTLEPTYPDGLDVEVMNFAALKKAWANAKLPSEREHVTPYIYKNQDLFKLGCLKNSEDLSELRWTVDEPEDFIFVKAIYEMIYIDKQHFTFDDILKVLKKNPEFSRINSKFKRNEGLLKSLNKDKKFLIKEEL